MISNFIKPAPMDKLVMHSAQQKELNQRLGDRQRHPEVQVKRRKDGAVFLSPQASAERSYVFDYQEVKRDLMQSK